MKKNNQKILIGFAFIFLLLILELFHRYVGLYYDDYGNASLSYGYDAGVIGIEWSLKDLISWAHWIYLNFSGRILCGSLLNILIKIGEGPRVFMEVQALVLVLLFFVIYRLVMKLLKKEDNVLAFVLIVALFFLLPDDMYKWNLCWASASVLYIWPLLPFFTAIILQFKIKEEDLSIRMKKMCTVIAMVCIMFTAFSHEQTGLSIVVYLINYCIYQKIKEGFIDRTSIVFMLTGILFYALLFFAPGNWVRLDGNTGFAELSFFEKIITQYQPLMNCLFCNTFIIYYALISFLLLYFSWSVLKKEKKKYFFIISLLAIALGGVVVISIYTNSIVIRMVFSMIYLLDTFIVLLIYHSMKNRVIYNILLFAAAASAFCVLISPSLPLRCFTEWIVVISIILCELGLDFVDDIMDKKNETIKKISILGVFFVYLSICILSAKRFETYGLGYMSNEATLEYNDKIMSDYTDENELFLKKLPDDTYMTAMPYVEGFDYIEYWMKQYYDIPNDVSLYWVTSDAYKNMKINESGDFYEDDWFGEDGTVTVYDCEANSMNLRCYIPYDMDCTSISIKVNGEEKLSKELQHGINDLIVPVVYDTDNIIQISAGAAFTDNPMDHRRLSCVLRYYFD